MSSPHGLQLVRPLVLHDADCGFCVRAASWIPRLGAAVDVSSLQAHDVAALGLDEDRCRREMPVLLADGTVVWGHHGWAEILRRSPVPLNVVGIVLSWPMAESIGAASYAWVARHRHQLPGSTSSCELGSDGEPTPQGLRGVACPQPETRTGG